MDTHRHHIIPRHEWKKRFGNLQGFNEPDNIVRLTLEQHIEVHKRYYEDPSDGIQKYGDKLAYQFLSGRIGKEEVLKEISRENQKKSAAYWRGRSRPKWSEEEKQKRSQKYKGEGNPFFGKKHTEETRKRNSNVHVGIIRSEESKLKQSESGKRAWASSPKRKLVGNGLLGKTHSEETRKKQSESAKKRWNKVKNNDRHNCG